MATAIRTMSLSGRGALGISSPFHVILAHPRRVVKRRALPIDNTRRTLSIGYMATNRPHYHVLVCAAHGRFWYVLRMAWRTKQAARQWASRNYGHREFIVRQCERPDCAPRLE